MKHPQMKTSVMVPTLAVMKEVIKVRFSAWSKLKDVSAKVTVGNEPPKNQELPFVISVKKGEKLIIESSAKGFKTKIKTIIMVKDTAFKVELPRKTQIRPRTMRTMKPMRTIKSGMALVGDGLL